MDHGEVRLGFESKSKAGDPTSTAEDRRAIEEEYKLLVEWANLKHVRTETETRQVKDTKGIEVVIGVLILKEITSKLIDDLYEYIKMRIKTRASKVTRFEIVYYEGGVEKKLEIKTSNYD